MFANRAYLLDFTHRVPKMLVLQELIDILANYGYNEFFVFAEEGTPESVDWMRLKWYGEIQGIKVEKLMRADLASRVSEGDYVRVTTAAERSLAGRVEYMRDEMIRVEAEGRERKTKGFLVTDFSDAFSWQPLVVSLPGIVMGGTFATGGAKSSMMDLEKELDRVMDAPLGGLLLRLGTLYLYGGAVREGESEFFNILSNEIGYSRHEGLTDAVLEEISAVAHGVRLSAERWIEHNDWAKEIAYAASLLECACHRRDEARLRQVRDAHGHIWRMRFEPEGRIESLSRLPRF